MPPGGLYVQYDTPLVVNVYIDMNKQLKLGSTGMFCA